MAPDSAGIPQLHLVPVLACAAVARTLSTSTLVCLGQVATNNGDSQPLDDT